MAGLYPALSSTLALGIEGRCGALTLPSLLLVTLHLSHLTMDTVQQLALVDSGVSHNFMDITFSKARYNPVEA